MTYGGQAKTLRNDRMAIGLNIILRSIPKSGGTCVFSQLPETSD